MTNITQYSEDELSLLVFNIKELYEVRHHLKELTSRINERYVYSIEQLKVLQYDIDQDLNDY